ncbi:Glu/Leu/Phe/Val dehydrogenase [Baekduia soli]|uniref:Glu/Leu/Phe/Val dehydrogenase n=1 Tax=Baekduia soli TaxID=496014 RepID=UPI0016525AF6|nr:Glu/Leu/Phe/Val dehydrogenase [Baekduia soli]
MSDLSIDAAFDDHEVVELVHDPQTGLRAIIAVHCTAPGPAMGGIRRMDYRSVEDALIDVLRLSRAMTAKNVMAGLPLGGGKTVMIDRGDPADPRQLAALGEAIGRLDGRYAGAEDIGTGPADMDVIARHTRHVVGRPASSGGSGDPSPTTARTVLHACLSALRRPREAGALEGIRAGVQGVGKVGAALARGLHALGADVVVADASAGRAERLADELQAAVAAPAALLDMKLDLLAPCAVGGVIDRPVAGRIRARVVCGAANNQLTIPGLADVLHERGVLYVPDYVANCGGIIQVGGEYLGWTPDKVEASVTAAIARCDDLLSDARTSGLPPAAQADLVVARRLEQLLGAAA